MAEAPKSAIVRLGGGAPGGAAGRARQLPRFALPALPALPPAGDQPAAIAQLVEGIEDGLSHQTPLGVTGSGKTFTMANVIARLGRPAIVFAPNKTLAAQLYSEFREFFPKNAVEYFVSYHDYYQPEAHVPQRDLFIERTAVDQRAHRADAPVGHQEPARAARRDHRGQRQRDLRHRQPGATTTDGDDRAWATRWPARRHRAPDPHAVPAQRDRLRARHLRVRGDTIDVFPAEHPSWRSASSCSTTRSRAATVRPADRPHPPEDPALHGLPVEPLRDAARPRWRPSRPSRRAAPAPDELVKAGKAGRGAAARAAHPLRPRDAAGGGSLQGHRELFAAPVRVARRAAADAGRPPAGRRADVPRRKPRADRPARRHVQRRPSRKTVLVEYMASACRARWTTGR